MYFFPIFVAADNHKDVFQLSKGEARFGLYCQMMVQQRAASRQSMMLMQNTETGLQLQQALEQISNISTALCDIQRYYQDQVCVDVMKREQNGFPHHVPSFFHPRVQVKQSQSAEEESRVLSELQNLKEQLEKSEEERTALETQLSEANGTVAQLQEEGTC